MSIINTLQKEVFAHPFVSTFNAYSSKAFQQMSRCHTLAMGKHTYHCSNADCRNVHYQYHSCGNRHCPNCGGLKRDEWIEKQEQNLLPTSYYHIVFTLPQELHPISLGNMSAMYKLLFESASKTLLTLGNDERYIGAKPCITMVLHTWGQDLSYHPHVHCIVSAGGVNKCGKWVNEKRKHPTFIFPKKAMQKVFKGIYLKGLRALVPQLKLKDMDIDATINTIGFKTWNVFAKAPFGGPKQVIEYLGRYTHKIAITKHRILSVQNGNITFKYKDYADGNKPKKMTLTYEEFLRRFEKHILPKGFCKIRHYGALAPHGRKTRLHDIRIQLKVPQPMPYVKVPIEIRLLIKTGTDITQCPKCKTGKLELVQSEPRKTFYYIPKKQTAAPT